jgi:regulator of RNase E activity RraA
MLGYAVAARIRSSIPPVTSPPITQGCYYGRMDFWRYLVTVPEPCVMVLQDADPLSGFGAFIGEIHAQIALALHCVGCVTSGAVRDLPTVEAPGFHLFSRSVSVSHAYAHIVDFGEPVEIGGLKIHPGELIHADCHGVHTIPHSIAAEIPELAVACEAEERALIELCHSPALTLDKLALMLRQTTETCIALDRGGSQDCG